MLKRKMGVKLQKSVTLFTIGVITYGILQGYSGFYKQVVQYTQSLAYREAQESIKEHRIQVKKKYQHLFSSDKSERSNYYNRDNKFIIDTEATS